jgi:hypothetical protein
VTITRNPAGKRRGDLAVGLTVWCLLFVVSMAGAITANLAVKHKALTASTPEVAAGAGIFALVVAVLLVRFRRKD